MNSRNGSTTSPQAGPSTIGMNSGATTQRNALVGSDSRATTATRALVGVGEAMTLVLHLGHYREQHPVDDPAEGGAGITIRL